MLTISLYRRSALDGGLTPVGNDMVLEDETLDAARSKAKARLKREPQADAVRVLDGAKVIFESSRSTGR